MAKPPYLFWRSGNRPFFFVNVLTNAKRCGIMVAGQYIFSLSPGAGGESRSFLFLGLTNRFRRDILCTEYLRSAAWSYFSPCGDAGLNALRFFCVQGIDKRFFMWYNMGKER